MRPYIFWTNTDLASHLKETAIAVGMGRYVKALIEEAMLTDMWDPTLDYNGCSIVQDLYHPCVSCFIHDYLWITGQGGKEADELFYYLMLKEGTKVGRAKRRLFAVRVAWFLYYKWKHFANRNVNKYSSGFLNALESLRHEYAG